MMPSICSRAASNNLEASEDELAEEVVITEKDKKKQQSLGDHGARNNFVFMKRQKEKREMQSVRNFLFFHCYQHNLA